MSESLLHGDLTYKIIGLGMQIHRTLGHGFLEKVYENSLMVLLAKSEIYAEQQVPIKVSFEGVIVDDYFADILVEGRVILELKTCDRITDIHKRRRLTI
jgi:GxxExxY protein